MKLIIALVFTAMATVTTSIASEHVRLDMEVLEIVEEQNSLLGWTIYKGSVVNNGNRTIQYPQIVITLKLDGKVIEFENAYIEGPLGNKLAPRETGFFEAILFTSRSDFDDYTVSFDGRLDAVSPEFVSGELRILEETLNGVEFLDDFAVLGEIINETNAVLTDVVIRFRLYDGDAQLIGFAEAEYSLPNEIYPDELVPFRANSDVAFGSVSSFELIEPIEYVADRIPFAPIPTTVEQVSWGEIKRVREMWED